MDLAKISSLVSPPAAAILAFINFLQSETPSKITSATGDTASDLFTAGTAAFSDPIRIIFPTLTQFSIEPSPT